MFYKLFGVFCSYEYDPALVLKSSHHTCYTKNTKKNLTFWKQSNFRFLVVNQKKLQMPEDSPISTGSKYNYEGKTYYVMSAY